MEWHIKVLEQTFKTHSIPKILDQQILTVPFAGKDFKVQYNSQLETLRVFESPSFCKVISMKNFIKTQNGFYSQFFKIPRVFETQIQVSYPSSAKRANLEEILSDEFHSPLTGSILKIIQIDGPVQKDQTILIIEAMKMENQIKAPKSGILELLVKSNSKVKTEDLLFKISNS